MTKHVATSLISFMAAEAAEARLTELLRDEVAKVEKQCIRPLHVR